jgi:hypothetical protein
MQIVRVTLTSREQRWSICGPSQGCSHRLIYSLCIAEVCYFVQGCLPIVMLFFCYVNILSVIVNLPMLIISWHRERESNGDLDYTGYSAYSPLQLLYCIAGFFEDIPDYECMPLPLLSSSILWPLREDMTTPRQRQVSFSQAFCPDSLSYNSADRTRTAQPYRDSNSDPLVVQLVASHYTDCAIPAPS